MYTEVIMTYFDIRYPLSILHAYTKLVQYTEVELLFYFQKNLLKVDDYSVVFSERKTRHEVHGVIQKR